MDMFLGTLSGPFFNHLIGSSSAEFTDLILTGERVGVGIRSGKIQKDVSASTTVKKPFTGRKEVSAVHSHMNQGGTERRPTVEDIMIPKPASDQPRTN